MVGEPPIIKAMSYLGDKVIAKAIDDPLAFLTNIDTITEVGMKFLPTLPGEYPFPIPRFIYDKLVRK